MLENYLFIAEKKISIFRLIIISLIITIILSVVNSFIGSNALFLVALISLFLAYPTITYIRSMDKEELENNFSFKDLINRHEKELMVFWSYFIGITLGFYISIVLGLTTDLRYQKLFVENVSGMLVNIGAPFLIILLNNIGVLFFTFILSLVSFSGLIFVISWNASLLAYYLYTIPSVETTLVVSLLLLPHALLEIGSYIIAGIAGSIVMYKIEKKKNLTAKHLNGEFIKDSLLLFSLSFLLVIIAAIIEIL